jgi:hypothetical protein
MVKLWIELWRRDGLSREAFLERLASDHAAAIAAGAEALGVRRAVLNRRIAAPEIDAFSDERGWAPAGDATVELWLDDLSALETALASADGREALARIEAVEREIANTSSSSAVVTHEHVVFDFFAPDSSGAAEELKRAARVKLVVQNQPHPSLTLAQFQAHWIDRHGPLVREVGPALGYRRYVQDHPLASPALDAYTHNRGWRTPPAGGVTEVWWDSRENQLAAFASEEGQRASTLMAEDEPRFVHPPAMTAFLATEQVTHPLAGTDAPEARP